MRKKIMALLMTIVVTAVCLSGCGSKAGEGNETDMGGSADTENQTASAEDSQEEVRRKIGCILYGKDDSMGSTVYSYLNYAAEALNVDLQWALNDYDEAAQLASCENLVSAGCEGIIFLPINDSAVRLISDYCEENEVYFQMMFRDISDSEIKEAAQANPYYVGTCFENDKETAKELVRILAEDGRTNLGQGKITPGTALSIRNEGFEEGAKEAGAAILADYTAPTDGSTQAYVTYIENFVNTYPEMNGLLIGSASAGGGETIINTLKSTTEPGTIKIAGFDTFEGMEAGFEEGYIAALVGGMSPDCLFGFIMLYNAVDQTPLAEGYTVLSQKFIFIKSAEDCATFAKYIDNPEYQIYDAETIRSLCVRYNENASLEDLQALMDQYSLEWVVENAE